jgi:hypothetical protein
MASERGLLRPRLLAALHQAPRALLVAPAGFGKTTVLQQFTGFRQGPVGRLVPSVRGLGVSLEGQRPRAASAFMTQLDTVPDLLLILDDAHELTGTPAEADLAALADALPASAQLLLAGRSRPAVVGADWLVLGPELLRFRPPEVTRLFADVYGVPIPPERAAELATRTGGWAVGLRRYYETQLAPRGAIRERPRRPQLANTPAPAPPPARPAALPRGWSGPQVAVRCFGGFRLSVEGRPADLRGLPADCAALLRAMAWQPGRAVPAPPNLASRLAAALDRYGLGRYGLRVAGSAEGYRLVLPPGGSVDVATFTQSRAAWRAAAEAGDADRARAALRVAVAAYSGDLLPEEGPRLVAARTAFRRAAAIATGALAAAELEAGNADAAARAAHRAAALALPWHGDPQPTVPHRTGQTAREALPSRGSGQVGSFIWTQPPRSDPPAR